MNPGPLTTGGVGTPPLLMVLGIDPDLAQRADRSDHRVIPYHNAHLAPEPLLRLLPQLVDERLPRPSDLQHPGPRPARRLASRRWDGEAAATRERATSKTEQGSRIGGHAQRRHIGLQLFQVKFVF